MKAVLMSIKPKWCELIASGKKTIEVRKTKPNLQPPFKAFIYCTSIKSMPLDEYVRIHRATDGKIDDWHSMVIGEFVCNAIISHCEMANADIAEQQGRIKREHLLQYANGKELYGWHISDLVIYDKPRELSEFRTLTDCNSKIAKDMLCNTCCLSANFCSKKPKRITRPPQSWCYVEEVDNG